MIICIPTAEGQPLKHGGILRNLADSFATKGVPVLWSDDYVPPDCYIVEAIIPKLRYKRPVIIHGENLINEGAKEKHSYREAQAIVFNSQWLRTLYANTFQYELPGARIIPPAFDDRRVVNSDNLYLPNEEPIVCCAKWAKRPYKRLPLHTKVIQLVREVYGHKDAKLHIFGWEPVMPYYHTAPYYWHGMNMRGVRFYQRSFERPTYPALLHGARLLLHASAIDSGPQTVMEAIARGIPAVVTNNMGAAEWIREIGPVAGEVVDVDPITDTYEKVRKITDTRFAKGGWLAQAWRELLHPIAYSRFLAVCSDISCAGPIVWAVDRQLNRGLCRYEPPRKFTMEGITEAWLNIIREVTGK